MKNTWHYIPGGNSTLSSVSGLKVTHVVQYKPSVAKLTGYCY